MTTGHASAFVKQHRARIVDAAENAMGTVLLEAERTAGIQSFVGVIDFLADNNTSIASVKEEFGMPAFLAKAASRYFKGRAPCSFPAMPGTVPDPMVSVVMQRAFGHAEHALPELARTHQQAMAAENAVGDLLERYLASILEPAGWYWCSGTLVRAVDFIRYDPRARLWESLQVKNRSNSENSSSAAIRNGTPIKHWFRTFAATGDTNWEAFPADSSCRGKLSESGFHAFVTRVYAGMTAR